MQLLRTSANETWNRGRHLFLPYIKFLFIENWSNPLHPSTSVYFLINKQLFFSAVFTKSNFIAVEIHPVVHETGTIINAPSTHSQTINRPSHIQKYVT